MRKILATLLWLAALMPAVGGGAWAQSESDKALLALDEAVLATYRHAKTEMLAATDPYIIVAFDTLYLRHRGETTRVPFTPPIYTQLKSIGHMALAADGALAPYLATPQAGPLALADRARTADGLIDQIGLPPESAARQHKLIRMTLGLVADVTNFAGEAKNGTRTEADLRAAVQARFAAYGKQAGPLLLANAAEAARAQVDGLDAAFRDFKGRLSPDEVARLYVIVLGLRMPRVGNLQFNYFVNAMGRDEIDRHLIYAEGVTDVKGGESLLSVIVTDRGLSAAFFDDPMRMDRDILADGAEARLLEIFGRLGAN